MDFFEVIQINPSFGNCPFSIDELLNSGYTEYQIETEVWEDE